MKLVDDFLTGFLYGVELFELMMELPCEGFVIQALFVVSRVAIQQPLDAPG